jgi:membrane protease YdiL (CAAX protease family)
MNGPLLVVGVVAQAIAWRLVALRRVPFWPTVGGIWAIVGTAALVLGDPRCCDDRGLVAALVVGCASGVVLYLATRVVVTFASRSAPIADQVEATYGRSAEATPGVVWLVSLAVVVPGEELFWRGATTPWLVDVTAMVPGAILAWLVAAGVAALWGSLPFLAAGAVGGAVWTALAVWSGGVAAPLASHVVWTACMIAWRPPTARAKVAA